MKIYEDQSSRSFFDLDLRHSDSIFSNFFSSITAKPIVEDKFHVEPPLHGGTKSYSNGPGHMTAMPIYGKNISQELLSLIQYCTWVDLGLFYGKVKFGPLCFCMGKKLDQWIFQKLYVVVCDIKVGRCSQLYEYMKLYEYQRPWSFIDLGPNHFDSAF